MLKNEPGLGLNSFQCPHPECKTVAQQRWFNSDISGKRIYSLVFDLYMDYRAEQESYVQSAIEAFLNRAGGDISRTIGNFVPQKFSIATCHACNDISLWVGPKMVYPRSNSIVAPNVDMDDDIKVIYNEAASIFYDSPKGATALLRLALQKLLKQVGKDGGNINSDIKELVAAGLSPKIQQALDLLRVVGNNAVHPGQINLDDNSEMAIKLFSILNFIAEELVTKPKELSALYDETIPLETRGHIEARDK